MSTTPRVLLPPWPGFLKEIAGALSQPVSLHCGGGFVLAALYGIPRSTADLDYIEVLPREAGDEVERLAGRDSALAKRYRLFLHGVMGIVDLPDGYETRLQELALDLRRLKLWALDPYDLLLSKLSRNSPKDREDAKYLIKKMNLGFAIFQARWETEMAPWIANKPHHDLTVQLWKEYFPR